MTPVSERDVVWYERDKRRHAIVLRVVEERGMAIVIWGTSTLRDERGYEHVCVDPAQRAGKALEVSGPTYFYRRSVEPAPLAKLELRGVRCPPDLFFELRELAGFGAGSGRE